KKERESYSAFVHEIISHLEALHRNPDAFIAGLEKTAFAMPTKGKLLEEMPTLPTMMDGLQALVDNLPRKIKLKNDPIFDFDQSAAPLFAKNSRYIAQLNRTHKSSIIHISQDEAVALAQKLHVEKLIQTTRTGAFG